MVEKQRGKRERAISILNSVPLKLGKFSLGNSVSSTEIDINIRRSKAWKESGKLALAAWRDTKSKFHCFTPY